MLGPFGGGDDAVGDPGVHAAGASLYRLVLAPGGLRDSYESSGTLLRQPRGDAPGLEQLGDSHLNRDTDCFSGEQGPDIELPIESSPTVGNVLSETPLCLAFRAAIHRDQDRGIIPKKGWQKAAGAKLGMSQSQVSDLYNGKRAKVEWDMLIKLVHYTGRSADELLGIEPRNELSRLNSEVVELRSQLREVLSTIRPESAKKR